MKEYTTEEIFNELWKRIEFDANVSEELATESNDLQDRIDKAIEYIEKVESVNKELKDSDMYWAYNTFFPELLDILKGGNNE